MKLRHPRLIALIAWLAAGLVRSWMATVRPRFDLPDSLRHPADPRQHRFIYAFWHEALLFPTRFPVACRVLISQHADGELIAQVIQHLGFGVVRGSTTRNGSAALLKMARGGGDAHLAITPDGPRGPRRQVQPGVVYLAQLTGLPVVPVGIAYDRAWRAGSWDRFLLPRPFTTARCVIAAPILVPAGLDRGQLERFRRQLEDAMTTATAAAERWAETGVRPEASVALKASA